MMYAIRKSYILKNSVLDYIDSFLDSFFSTKSGERECY